MVARGGSARRLARRVAMGKRGWDGRIRRRRVVVVPSWTWRLHGRRRLRPSRRITTRGIATTRRMMRRTSTPSGRRWLPRRGAEREAAANGGALGHLLAGYGDATERRDARRFRRSRRRARRAVGQTPRRRERPRLLLEQGHGRGGVDARGDARRHVDRRRDTGRTGRPDGVDAVVPSARSGPRWRPARGPSRASPTPSTRSRPSCASSSSSRRGLADSGSRPRTARATTRVRQNVSTPPSRVGSRTERRRRRRKGRRPRGRPGEDRGRRPSARPGRVGPHDGVGTPQRVGTPRHGTLSPAASRRGTPGAAPPPPHVVSALPTRRAEESAGGRWRARRVRVRVRARGPSRRFSPASLASPRLRRFVDGTRRRRRARRRRLRRTARLRTARRRRRDDALRLRVGRRRAREGGADGNPNFAPVRGLARARARRAPTSRPRDGRGGCRRGAGRVPGGRRGGAPRRVSTRGRVRRRRRTRRRRRGRE